MKYAKCYLFSLILLFFINSAFASLLVSPTRAVFEGRDRVKEITLINTSDRTNTYRVGWKEQKQLADSTYEKLTQDELLSFRKASDFIRFSPKQVRLKPGERQVVKMLVRKKSEMDNGDFRSHLSFTVIPDNLESQVASSSSGGMGIDLNLFVNYSIPVVIRKGVATESVTFVSAEALQNPGSQYKADQIKIELARSGLYGSYGKVQILGKQPGSNEDKVLGELNGLNFLHENTTLTHYVPITEKDLFEQQSSVTINYISDLGVREVLSTTYVRL